MTSRNTSSTAKTSGCRRTRLPYYEHARTWQRYLRRLRDKPFDAYLKKEEAISHSICLRGRSFVVPAQLAPKPGARQGLLRLRRWMIEEGQRFVELVAKAMQVDADDPYADEVHLFIEEPDPTSSRSRRRFVGALLQEDAFWALPLLKLETGHYGTGPTLRFFVERLGGGGEVDIVIAGAHEAARNWLDWQADRQAYRERCEPW